MAAVHSVVCSVVTGSPSTGDTTKVSKGDTRNIWHSKDEPWNGHLLTSREDW